MCLEAKTKIEIMFYEANKENDFPWWASKEAVVDFLHYKMKPYEDSIEDIENAMDYVFNGPGGFVMLTHFNEQLSGVLVMLNTGMKGYIPENILLMVSVDPELRGNGIGEKLIERCIAECEGEVKLHVEYENPAKRLYERIGFTTKYAEMRLSQ
ncbi:MAG: GNAT family N-acetyltransferase [Candidatus Electryonea clarkiae]|nr:GNAT family N-acetyltransferase [Candidatus Electryonea clarkiae]MDP8287667.1 GNAT family N-acetyltransferase [Candidatus Electryonea clarkiae]